MGFQSVPMNAAMRPNAIPSRSIFWYLGSDFRSQSAQYLSASWNAEFCQVEPRVSRFSDPAE